VDGEQGQGTWINLERYLTSESPQANGDTKRDDDSSERGPDDIILLLSTSGTTSLPKGCPLSNRNLVSAAFGMGEVFEIDKDSVALNHMPLSHGMSIYFSPHYGSVAIADICPPSLRFLFHDLLSHPRRKSRPSVRFFRRLKLHPCHERRKMYRHPRRPQCLHDHHQPPDVSAPTARSNPPCGNRSNSYSPGRHHKHR
jgi:hypothetical protein